MRPRCSDNEYFHYYNANPKDKITSDCVIRALCVVTGMKWDDVLDELVMICHKVKSMPNNHLVYERFLKAHGFSKQKQPRKDSGGKVRGWEFCESLHGLTSCKIFTTIGTRHVVAIAKCGSEYKIYDHWNVQNDIVGTYWLKFD